MYPSLTLKKFNKTLSPTNKNKMRKTLHCSLDFNKNNFCSQVLVCTNQTKCCFLLTAAAASLINPQRYTTESPFFFASLFFLLSASLYPWLTKFQPINAILIISHIHDTKMDKSDIFFLGKMEFSPNSVTNN